MDIYFNVWSIKKNINVFNSINFINIICSFLLAVYYILKVHCQTLCYNEMFVFNTFQNVNINKDRELQKKKNIVQRIFIFFRSKLF